MDSRIVVGSCATSAYSRIEEALRALPDVESVGSLREKRNNKRDRTSVYITFCTVERAQSSAECLSRIDGLVLGGTSDESSRKQAASVKSAKPRDKDVTAALLLQHASTSAPLSQASPESAKRDTPARKPRRRTRRLVSQVQAPSSSVEHHQHQLQQTEHDAPLACESADTRQHGSGATAAAPDVLRAANMRTPHASSRQRAPPFEASVVFVDHVPFGTPNDVLMERFAPYGRVLDVNRFDTLVMVCYDNPASAQECVQRLNGTRFGDHIITTYGPHKAYKYTYMPDPRKLAPIERTHASEILPTAIRPPSSFVPNHEVFLEKADIHRLQPTSEFKATFKDWDDLMTCSVREMRNRGVPRRTRAAIYAAVNAWHHGTPPEFFDTKEEWLYYKQFDTKDYSYRIIPELPEKYRPHQNGVEQAPVPDYVAINQMPQWAVDEERRLAAKRSG